MKLNRVWSIPSKWTFQIRPIAELLTRYNVGSGWADPFAGQSRLCEYRNDLNPANQQPSQVEALDFIQTLSGPLRGVVFDPPYSLTQVARSYSNFGLKFKGKENPTGGFPRVKNAIIALVEPNGVVISFGWNSCGMGKTRGFELEEILLVCHGGNRNDTIVTVERKRDMSGFSTT